MPKFLHSSQNIIPVLSLHCIVLICGIVVSCSLSFVVTVIQNANKHIKKSLNMQMHMVYLRFVIQTFPQKHSQHKKGSPKSTLNYRWLKYSNLM